VAARRRLSRSRRPAARRTRPGRTWSSLTAGLRQGRRVDADAWRAASLIVVGRLIARAALRREESRGAHWRADFPEKDDVRWNRHAGDEFAIT
jgi:succinate dehydrogenase/fumarate reductase flavoprotein subunit